MQSQINMIAMDNAFFIPDIKLVLNIHGKIVIGSADGLNEFKRPINFTYNITKEQHDWAVKNSFPISGTLQDKLGLDRPKTTTQNNTLLVTFSFSYDRRPITFVLSPGQYTDEEADILRTWSDEDKPFISLACLYDWFEEFNPSSRWPLKREHLDAHIKLAQKFGIHIRRIDMKIQKFPQSVGRQVISGSTELIQISAGTSELEP